VPFFFHPAKKLLIASPFIQVLPGQQFLVSEKLISFSLFCPFFLPKHALK
jgi:hypothetical protein